MASSKRSWTALPLFSRIRTEKGTLDNTEQFNNGDSYLKDMHMPLLQPHTDTNSTVQVPHFPYAPATKEPQDALVSRQLPFPTTSLSRNLFEMQSTPGNLDHIRSSSVSSTAHRHSTQEHHVENPDLDTKAAILPYGLSKDSMPTAVSSSQQTVAKPLEEYGIPLHSSSVSVSKAWCCGFPGCKSQVIFTRACDLHKHYKRHSQRFYCRKESCSRSAEGGSEGKISPSGPSDPSNSTLQDPVSSGSSRARHRWFASKKDRDRHEAKHSPRIQCTWRGSGGEHCPRVFSRLDNMKDHIRRVHKPTTGQNDED